MRNGDVLKELPEYASVTCIGQLLGKSARRIQQLTQDGVLRTEQPPSGGRRMYRTAETIQNYVAYVERRTQEKLSGTSAEELGKRKLEAEIALKESQGKLQKMKAEIAEGKYLEVEKAEQDLKEYLEVFHRFLMAVPDRVAGILSNHVDAPTARIMAQDLRKEIEAMLVKYADAAEVRKP